jgi:hypothetical protein
MSSKLQQARQELKHWQNARTIAQRQGWCLGATRYALTEVGLKLPAPQPKPNNTARWNGYTLAANPAKWGWLRIAPTAAAFNGLRLDYFDGVARLDDGRIAGHVGITDPAAGIIYSAIDFDWNSNWSKARMASFVPMTSSGGVHLSLLSTLAGASAAVTGTSTANILGIEIESGELPAPPENDAEFLKFVEGINAAFLTENPSVVIDAEQ